MADMEFLSENQLNTTTQLVVSSNTGTVNRLFDRRLTLQYATSGFTSNTSTLISVVFDDPTVISHIILQNHNLRDFSAHFNSLTANALFSTTTNSATSTYHSFASTTVNSIDLQIDASQTEVERLIGQLVFSNREVVFERNPSHKDFKPRRMHKQIVHSMPDGGAKVINFSNKKSYELKWKHITESFRNTLENLHTAASPLYFVPFPTTTGWDGDARETVWIGPFDFKDSIPERGEGFEGKINLRESAGG